MKTESLEFKGWTYDRQAERVYAPCRLLKAVKAIFYTCFWVLAAAGIVASTTDLRVPGWLCLAGFIGMAASVAAAFIGKALSEKAPRCAGCGKPMALIATLPSPAECGRRGYTQGPSGHAYTQTSDAVYEVRKNWYACGTCRRYFLLDGQATEIIGGIEEREADYTQAGQAIAAALGKRSRKKKPARGPR